MEPDTTEIDRQRKALLAFLEDLKKQETARKEQLEVARAACLMDLEKRQENTRRQQEQCPHRKLNQKSAVVGQQLRFLGNERTFVCQFCQKEWDETTIPPELAPTLPVGGASFVEFYGPKEEATTRSLIKEQQEEEEYQSTRPVYDIEKDFAWALWYERQNWFVRFFLHPKLQYLAKRYNNGKFVERYLNCPRHVSFGQRIRFLFTGRYSW